MRESLRARHQTAQCSLCSDTGRVYEDAAAIYLAFRSAGQCINPFFQSTGRIAAIECYLRHQCVRDTMEEHIRGPRIMGRVARKTRFPMTIAGQKLLVARFDDQFLQPSSDGSVIKMNEDAFAKLLNCREPIGAVRDRCPMDGEPDVFDIPIGTSRRRLETCKALQA